MRPEFPFQHPEFALINLGPAGGAPVVAGPDRARLRGVGRALDSLGLQSGPALELGAQCAARGDRLAPDPACAGLLSGPGRHSGGLPRSCSSNSAPAAGTVSSWGTVRRGHSFWMNDHTTHSAIVRALQHGLKHGAARQLCQHQHLPAASRLQHLRLPLPRRWRLRLQRKTVGGARGPILSVTGPRSQISKPTGRFCWATIAVPQVSRPAPTNTPR